MSEHSELSYNVRDLEDVRALVIKELKEEIKELTEINVQLEKIVNKKDKEIHLLKG